MLSLMATRRSCLIPTSWPSTLTAQRDKTLFVGRMMKHRTYVGLLLVATTLAAVVSCHRERQEQPNDRPFAGVSLPQVRSLRCEDYGSQTVSVCIEKNGAVSISRTHLSLPTFAAVIQRAFSQAGSQMSVHIGADVAAPFDKVWPVVLVCRTNGLASVRFAVTDSTGQGINVIRAFLPRRTSDTVAASPLILKDDADILTIGVQPNAFTVADRRLDQASLRALLQRLESVNGNSKTVAVIPSPGIRHGQLMLVLAACREVGLENICIMEEQAQQSAAPLPPAPRPGPSEGAR